MIFVVVTLSETKGLPESAKKRRGMGNFRCAKFTHFLAEFMKSFQAPGIDPPWSALLLNIINLRHLYTKCNDVFCCFTDVFLTFKLTGQQKLSCPLDGPAVRFRRLHCFVNEISIIDVDRYIRIPSIIIWNSPRGAGLSG